MRKIFILITSLFIASCGFHGMYLDEDNNTSYAPDLAAIRIQKDRDHLGQELRNNLYDLLNPDYIKSDPKYFLVLRLTKNMGGTYITNTGASGRNRVTLNITYELKNLDNAMVISRGTTSVFDNYDVTTNRYGTYVTDDNVSLNLTEIAAQNIRNALVNDLIEVRKRCAGEIADDIYDEQMVDDERGNKIKKFVKREFVCPFTSDKKAAK